jgi:hypothetical protein
MSKVDLDAKIPVGKAHLHLPNRPCYDTVRKWRKNGVMSRKTGKRVYLKWGQQGGMVYITLRMYQRFMKELEGE